MINLSNGHSFEYMVASGALAFDGKGWFWERPLAWFGLLRPELFTVVIKTLTRDPRKGHLCWWKPWTCVRLIPGGSVNKVGLTNKGIDWWCREIGPRLDFHKVPLVGSIFGSEKDLVEMAIMLNRFNLVGLEVNPSCPNTGHAMQTAEAIVKMVKAVERASRHPIFVKVSVDQDYVSIARGLENIAQAMSLNSVPWKTAFPNAKKSPLHRLENRVGGGGGGVSGRPAQLLNWHAVKVLAINNDVPVIGPSVMEYADLAKVREAGASAVSFGAIHLRTPWAPTSIVKQDQRVRNYTLGAAGF